MTGVVFGELIVEPDYHFMPLQGSVDPDKLGRTLRSGFQITCGLRELLRLHKGDHCL